MQVIWLIFQMTETNLVEVPPFTLYMIQTVWNVDRKLVLAKLRYRLYMNLFIKFYYLGFYLIFIYV